MPGGGIGIQPECGFFAGDRTGRGVERSAAIVIETPDGEVIATVRLAPTDVAGIPLFAPGGHEKLTPKKPRDTQPRA